MTKERSRTVDESEKSSRKPTGTFLTNGYPSEHTRSIIATVLTYLFGAANEIPTIYIDELQQTLTAEYGETNIFLKFIVVEQALRTRCRNGNSNILISPSLQEAMELLCEIEGHRQMTWSPIMRHPTKYALKRNSKNSRNAQRRQLDDSVARQTAKTDQFSGVKDD
jgi:hypothetical protein